MKIMATISLTKDEFVKRVAHLGTALAQFKFVGGRPAVVDFYADWCGPCNMVAPVMEDLSKEYDGKVDFYKINVDEENELSAYFGIRSIPTILFITADGAMSRHTGAMLREQLNNEIKMLL